MFSPCRIVQTSCRREGDSNRRSLSRNDSLSPVKREVPQRQKGVSRERHLSCGGTKGSKPLPSATESVCRQRLGQRLEIAWCIGADCSIPALLSLPNSGSLVSGTRSM